MPTLESLYLFIIASTLLALAPGPDNIFVLTQSALYGIRSGMAIILGLCTGLIFHTSIVALGIAAIFKASALAFTILKTIGALYLLYLAWQALMASKQNINITNGNILTYSALYKRGVIMNITNPKVSIFFLAFLPQFTSPENSNTSLQILFLGALFACTGFAVFTLISITAKKLGEWLKKSDKAQAYLNRITGFVFIILSLKLVFTDAP